MRNKYVKYALCGALAGAINGFFGAAGGVLLVPLLLFWLRLPEKRAFATSVFIILPISAVSFIIYAMSKNASLSGSLPYLLGGFCGGVLCARVFDRLPQNLLHKLFGIMLIIGGIRYLL